MFNLGSISTGTLKDEDLIRSLKSLQWDTDSDKIFSSNAHIAEGIIRGLWLIKNKKLNPFVY